MILSHRVLFFVMCRCRPMHRFNHAFGNVFMKINVRQLSTLVVTKIARCLVKSVNQIEFNHLELFRQVSFATEKIKVNFIFVITLNRLLCDRTYHYLFFYCDTECRKRRDDNSFFNDDEHCAKYVDYICF
jgi:hypothetical protein